MQKDESNKELSIEESFDELEKILSRMEQGLRKPSGSTRRA